MTTYTGKFTNKSGKKVKLTVYKEDGKNVDKELTITSLNINSNSEASNIFTPIKYTSLDFSILTDDLDIYKGAFLNAGVDFVEEDTNKMLWEGKIIEIPQNQAFNQSKEVLSFAAVDQLTLLKSEIVDTSKKGYCTFADYIGTECLLNKVILWCDYMTLSDGTSLLGAKFNYANYIEASDSIVYKTDILSSILEYCGLSIQTINTGTNLGFICFNPLFYVQSVDTYMLINGDYNKVSTINFPVTTIDCNSIAQAGVQMNWQPQINSITLTGTYKSLEDAENNTSSSNNDTNWLTNYYLQNNTKLIYSATGNTTNNRYYTYDNSDNLRIEGVENSQVATAGDITNGYIIPAEAEAVKSVKMSGTPQLSMFGCAAKGVFASLNDKLYKVGQFSYQKYGFKPDVEYYCYPTRHKLQSTSGNLAINHGFKNVIYDTMYNVVGQKSLQEYIEGFTKGVYTVKYNNSTINQDEKYRRLLNNYMNYTVKSDYTVTYNEDNNYLTATNNRTKGVINLSLFGCCEVSVADKVSNHTVAGGVISDANRTPDEKPSFSEKTIVYGTYGLTCIANKAAIKDHTNFMSSLKEDQTTLIQYPLITKKVTIEALPLKNNANSTKTLSFLISGSVDLNPYQYSLTCDSSMLSKTVEGTGAAKMLIKIDLYNSEDKLIFSSFKDNNPATNPNGATFKTSYSAANLECSSGNSIFNWSVKNNVGWTSGVKGAGQIYTPWQEFVVDNKTYSIYDIAYYTYTVYPVAYFELPALKEGNEHLFPVYSYTQDIKVELVEGWNSEEEEEEIEGDAEEEETTNQVVYYWKNGVNPLVNGTDLTLDNKLVTYNQNMQSISSPSYNNTYINELSCVGYPDTAQTSEVYRFGQLVDQYSTPTVGCIVPIKGYDAIFQVYKYPYISTENLIPLRFSYDAVTDINTLTLIEKKKLTTVQSVEL